MKTSFKKDKLFKTPVIQEAEEEVITLSIIAIAQNFKLMNQLFNHLIITF
jgi:hypothetical protein